MKVYVVWVDFDDGRSRLERIFSTKENAQNYVKYCTGIFYSSAIEEWDVDDE